jgi:tetratricopeptide (TPR) repeat protein
VSRPRSQDSDLDALERALDGRFALFGAVGAGQSGTVHRARARTDGPGWRQGEELALKILRPELAADPSARAQLLAEAKLGQKVRSPHVVRFLDADDVQLDDGSHVAYLVTGFVHGRSLRDLLTARGPAIGDLAVRIAAQCAEGLAALHAAGIVHRDLKPENILITDLDAEIRIADLGLARSARHAPAFGSSGGFHGSLAYAAPELLSGRPASPASDLYALGVVLFEVVTGQHPFPDHSGDEMLHAHLHVRPPKASHIQPRTSAFIDAILADLLAKDPADRPTSAADLAATLRDGEASAFWRAREKVAPVLASRRRLDAMRRSRHTAFFGRREERRTLDRLLEAAVRGSGRAVLVQGHGGVGRRRLLDECVDSWLGAQPGLTFLGGIADGNPAGRVGAPFTQILVDAFLDGESEDSPQAVDRLAARFEEGHAFDEASARALARLCAGDARSVDLPLAARADLLARGVEQLAKRSPRAMVVRIDRIHDLGSVARLCTERLIERCADLPLLLLLVGRPWSEDLLAGQDLRVGPLPESDFMAFGRALFEGGAAPDDALFRAAARTFSGNPRALLDSLEGLAMEGQLRGAPGRFHDLDGKVTELRPARPALQQLRSRIASLPRAEQHILQAAAVLGDRFDVDDVAKLTGRPELEVLESLGAVDHRIVSVDQGRGRFRHRDYRLATIAATPAEARRRLHRDAAWVREERSAPALEIGLHLSRALEDEACLEPLLTGLEGLVQQQARQAAIRVVERLRLHLNRLPRSKPNLERRLRWLLLAGEVYAATLQEERSARSFRKAVLIARHLDLPGSRARGMIGLADLAQHRGRHMSALQLLSQAEEILGAAAGDPVAGRDRARASLVHARILAYQGLASDALRVTQEALRTLPRPTPGLEAHLRTDLARWQALRMRFPRALASLDEALELAHEAGDPLAETRVLVHRGRTRGAIGELDAARADLDLAHEFARRLGDHRMRGRARLFRAELDVYVGRHADARPFLLDASRAAERARDRVTTEMAAAFLRAGEPEPAAPLEVPITGIPVADLAWLVIEGSRRRRAGDEAHAARLLDGATQVERVAKVHVLLRLATLRATGRASLADRLVRALASQVRAGSARRRFLAFAEQVRL